MLINSSIARNNNTQIVSILPVNASKIDSVTVEPQQDEKVSLYTLKISLDNNNPEQVISIIRPLDGELVDLKLHDIDEDGTDEVIVIMADHYATAVHVHFDIFEFDGKNIILVKDFTHMTRLYELFNTTTH